MGQRNRFIFILSLLLIIGGLLRFVGINWDEGFHLQPDERYVSMVISGIKWPKSVGEYLDPHRSPLSPYISGYESYIYGQLPLTILRGLGFPAYGENYLIGRAVSALLDTFSILLTYFLGKRLGNRRTGVLAAMIYTFLPLSLQYAHFMVMESWVIFSWLLVLLSLSWWKQAPRSFWRTFISGIALGASLAIKLSSVVLLGLFVGTGAVLSIPVGILAFRFFQPTIFSSVSWLDWSLEPHFRQAFDFQRLAIHGDVMFPPQWQWMNTPAWWFPFRNLFLWGFGPLPTILAVVGIMLVIVVICRSIFRFVFCYEKKLSRRINLLVIKQILNHRYWYLGLLAGFCIGVFVWQGQEFVKSMRYFIGFFPIYALFGAIALDSLLRRSRFMGKVLTLATFITSAIFALMLTSVYRHPQTRVAASRWIYQHIPQGATVALEEWDDPLPLGLPGQDISRYQTFQMAVYAPDSPEKAQMLQQWAQRADWIVLSSNRARGSIGRLPKDFPLMSRFYHELDQGTLGFHLFTAITSYPTLSLGHYYFSLPDESAEESFWVYDHPTVLIYQKTTP